MPFPNSTFRRRERPTTSTTTGDELRARLGAGERRTISTTSPSTFRERLTPPQQPKVAKEAFANLAGPRAPTATAPSRPFPGSPIARARRRRRQGAAMGQNSARWEAIKARAGR